MTSFERTGSFPRRRNAMLPPVPQAAPAGGGRTDRQQRRSESEEEDVDGSTTDEIMLEQAVGSFQYQEALAPLVPGQSMALWRGGRASCGSGRGTTPQVFAQPLQCFRESVFSGDVPRMAVGVRTPQQLVLAACLSASTSRTYPRSTTCASRLSKVPGGAIPGAHLAPRSARNSPDARLLL